MENLDYLETNENLRILYGLIGKTDRLHLSWTDLGKGNYKTSGKKYDYYLTYTGRQLILDISSDSWKYSYSSDDYDEVRLLYDIVVDIIHRSKPEDFMKSLWGVKDCVPPSTTHNIDSVVKIVADGLTNIYHVIPAQGGIEISGTNKLERIFMAYGGLVNDGQVDITRNVDLISEGGIVVGSNSNRNISYIAGISNHDYIGDTADNIDQSVDLFDSFSEGSTVSKMSSPGSDTDLFVAGSYGCVPVNLPNETTYLSSLKTWVENGGRLFLGTENYPCNDSVKLNEILSALGSTMVAQQTQYDCGELFSGRNQNVPVMNGVDPFVYACSSTIENGTPLVLAASVNESILSMEKIGNGYIAVTGDSNVLHYDDNDSSVVSKDNMLKNAQLFENIATNPDSQML